MECSFSIVRQAPETRFHMRDSFQSTISRSLSQKKSDVLKYKDEVFNIRGKLIWQSDIRSPSSCSQSVWDAMIIDATASNTISMWEEHFTKVKENSFDYITNMKKRNFNGISLNTQRVTEFSESEPFEMMDSCVEVTICCLEIMDGSVNVYHICNNPNCRKKLQWTF